MLGVFVFGLLHITRVPVGSEERLEAPVDEAAPVFSPYGALGDAAPYGGGKVWGYGTAGGEGGAESSYL